MAKKKNTVTAEEFDQCFDAGEDISDFLDWDNAKSPGLSKKRVNVDLPMDDWVSGSGSRTDWRYPSVDCCQHRCENGVNQPV